jgi:hypothetical protein
LDEASKKVHRSFIFAFKVNQQLVRLQMRFGFIFMRYAADTFPMIFMNVANELLEVHNE